MDKKNEKEEALKTMATMEEIGNTLMLIGLTCLFLWLTIIIGAAVPVFTLIFGAGASFAAKIIKKVAQ